MSRPEDSDASRAEDAFALEGDDGDVAAIESPPGQLAYQGTIAHFARGARSGVVRSASGREIPFDLQHVIIAASLLRAPGEVDIEVGQAIGYDVGWTSRGLRITKLFPI